MRLCRHRDLNKGPIFQHTSSRTSKTNPELLERISRTIFCVNNMYSECGVLVMLAVLQLSSGYHLAFFVPFKHRERGHMRWREGRRYAHALTIAIDDINNDPNILPDHNLTYSWNDTTDHGEVFRAMYQNYLSPVNGFKSADVFIGPAFRCHAPAKVAQAFKIPMISYFCREGGHFTKKEYPLFIRTYQNTNNEAASAVLTLLREQQWKRIGIIYENVTEWKGLTKTIGKLGDEHGLDIVAKEPLPSHQAFTVYGTTRSGEENVERNLSLKHTREVLTKMAKNKRVKIFVLLTSFNVLLDVMAEAYLLNLTGTNKPHRAFIGMQLDIAKQRENYSGHKAMFINVDVHPVEAERPRRVQTMRAARSLLIISFSKPQNTERYEMFRQKVIDRTLYEPPFNDSHLYIRSLNVTTVSEIAPALYDAVYQYALALDRLHKRNATISAQAVVEEFRNRPYVGMSGYKSQFRKKDGALQVSLSLLHLDEEVTLKNIETAQVNAVGSFEYNESFLSGMTYRNDQEIIWPWGTEKPTDQLNCKDDSVNCESKEKSAAHHIVPIVLSVVFSVIFIVLIILFVRQWRRERELKRSVWQIDINDIVFDRKISTDSSDSGDPELDSLLEGSRQNFDSTMQLTEHDHSDVSSLKTFSSVKIITGHFKGDPVFVKILPRNVEISKPLQKELRMLRHIRHENLNPFLGLGCGTSYLWIVMQLGSKGTLEEVLANPDISLNHTFVLSLVYDIAKGMTFLHSSDIRSHGNLKSSNCVIDNRWVLKITDYGIPQIRSRQMKYSFPDPEDKKFKDLLWKAPELLRLADPPLRGTQKADVYSFSIILEELHTSKSPYSNGDIAPRQIIDRVVDVEVPPFRPIVVESIENAECLLELMKKCWQEIPEKRPSFVEIRYDIESAMTRCGLKTDICDNMITLLENYSSNLETIVSKRTRQLRDEKQKTDALLDRMLPRTVAEQLKKGESVQAESFSSVTIYFSDIVQFTALCAQSTPMEVVDLLNDLYLLFDDVIMDYNVYKVETIGDAYMVVSGLPMRNGKLHASEICCMAIEILDNVRSFKVKHKPEHELQVRIGVHTGPVVAGVVGMTMPRYCLFGDTVNTASRMESNGKALRIHVSESTKDVLKELGGFYLQQRPEQVHLKGKGYCTTYWLQGASPDVPRCPRKLSKKALKPLFQNIDKRKLSAPFRTRKKTLLSEVSIPRASVA